MAGWTLLASAAEIALAGGLAVAAWVAAALLERRRARAPTHATARRRWARLALLAVAFAALVVLQARPARLTAPEPATGVLLTPGATAADAAAATVRGELAFAVAGRPGEPAPGDGAVPLPDAAALARNRPEVGHLHIHGHGLTAAEWADLPAAVSAAPPPRLPTGVRRVAWQRRLVLGETLAVRGEAIAAPGAAVTVSLRGAGIAEATARLAAGGGPFAFNGVPRAVGRHLLSLRVAAEGLPPVEERLDLEVLPAAPPAILWLEDSPTLESRELGRWLGASGGTLAVRSRVSRGADREQVSGLPEGLSLARLTPDLLARFDLLVADGGAFATLGAGDVAAVSAAVREGGLGLLLRPEEEGAGAPAPLGVRFPLRPVAGAAELTTRLTWANGEEMPELALAPRDLAPAADLVPLASDPSGRLLAAWRPLGAGAVGVSLVDGTWRWVREGNATAHRRYWREVLRAVGRPATPAERWSASAGPLQVGRAVTLSLETDTTAPRAVVAAEGGGEVTPGLRQDPREPRRWTTTWWPRSEGWHRVGEGPGAAWLWAAPADRWVTLRLGERQEATAARVAGAAGPGSGSRGEGGPAPSAVVRRPVPLPRWPWFAVLVAALGALWLDEMWRRSRPSALATNPPS